jgi:VanZ family protein
MLQKVFYILIHPLLIYAVIAALECIPHESHLGEKVYHEMPKVGDNFQIVGDLEVYYFNGKGKYSYTTPDCYFGFGNPSWGARYEDGGIKTIDAYIANQIPFLGKMCGEKTKVDFVKSTATKEKIYSTSFLLDYFSGVSHIISYFILSLSILYNLRLRKDKYWITFIAIFIGGGILEFVQELFIIGRSASIEDQVSNCLGAIVGMMLFWILLKTKLFNKIM